LRIAVATYGPRSHPNYPAEFDAFIDVNADTVDDFVVFNQESDATGQNVTSVRNLATSSEITRFFTEADLNSETVIMTVLMSDLGLTPSSQFRFAVYGADNYYTGLLTDSIGPMTYRSDTPRFTGSGLPAGGVPINGVSPLAISRDPAGDAASPSQSGLLLLYRDALSGREADAITVNP
jgi:hypothetical protein